MAATEKETDEKGEQENERPDEEADEPVPSWKDLNNPNRLPRYMWNITKERYMGMPPEVFEHMCWGPGGIMEAWEIWNTKGVETVQFCPYEFSLNGYAKLFGMIPEKDPITHPELFGENPYPIRLNQMNDPYQPNKKAARRKRNAL